MAFKRFPIEDARVNDSQADTERDAPLITLNAIALRQAKKTRVEYNSVRERKEVDQLLRGKLPEESEVYKIISGKGGFSSTGLISYVANKKRIERLDVSTFAIGKAQAQTLSHLDHKGLLGEVRAITSSLMGDGEKYGLVFRIFERHDWKIKAIPNHSKVLLMRCEDGSCYVCETSSNLNENPRIEQYSLECDEALYRFYLDFFDAIFETL